MTQPRRPANLPEYAQECLDALARHSLGEKISLGGAFGLAHYFEYRTTHDVDAWWVEPVTGEVRQQIINALHHALQPFGQVRVRSWGDVVSVELSRENKTIFSFQIARRSAQLQEPVSGVWPGGIWLDAFDDLVASKMVALVERGAPRDFRDIYTLCQEGQCTVGQCWKLWRERQRLAGEDADLERAYLAVRTHLARIEQSRPLERIADLQQRSAAEKLREWFVEEFLHGSRN